MAISITRTVWRIKKSKLLEKSAHVLQNASRFKADFCSTEKVTPGGYYRFTGIIYDLLSGLHWIEILLIIYGFYRFWSDFKFKKKLRGKVLNHIMCYGLFTCSCKRWGCFTCSYKGRRWGVFTRTCKCCCWSVLTLGIIAIYSGVALATPILNLIHADGVCSYQADTSCNTWNERIHNITVVHEWLSIGLRPFFILIRFTMVFAVVAVYIIWNEFDTPQPENAPNNYTKEKRKLVVQILEIYQQWFVVQWLIYYIALFTDVTTLLRPLVTHTEETLSTCSSVQIGLHIGYSVLSFGIPYVCGLRMSVYHAKYYNEKVRNEYLSTPQEMQHVLAHIEKDRKCDFVPHIKWTGSGISIPIDGPGFTIGSLLTIFAIAIAIVGFS